MNRYGSIGAFSHPDYTVGSGLTGSTRNWLAGSAAVCCPTAGRDL